MNGILSSVNRQAEIKWKIVKSLLLYLSLNEKDKEPSVTRETIAILIYIEAFDGFLLKLKVWRV